MLTYLTNSGIFLGVGTMFMVTCLELTNLRLVFQLINHNGIYSYTNAWLHSTVNAVIFGPFVYYIVNENLVDNNIHPITENLVNISSLLIVHSCGYWLAHNAMHKKYLWFIHKFHHTYSKYVTPVVAMAVSPLEYFLAYMLPFIAGSYLIYPSNFELITSASIISICNLMIHCPSIDNISKLYPKWWVTPEKHLKHHSSSKKCHIAAPTIDIDFILVLFSGYW